MININEKTLMKLQQRLGRHGLYDEMFKAHKGKHFYLPVVNDFVMGNNRMINFIHAERGEDSVDSLIHVPSPNEKQMSESGGPPTRQTQMTPDDFSTAHEVLQQRFQDSVDVMASQFSQRGRQNKTYLSKTTEKFKNMIE